MFAPSVGAMPNGAHAFVTSGGAAWRRRQRRLRAFRRYVLWHSKMEVATALHHTSGLRRTAVEPSTPFVVGSLPPGEEFALPVFYQVHQEQSAAGEMTENSVESPVVQEQVIVQAILRVFGSLPPCEVFAAPVFDQVHQVQFAAGETTVNIPGIPVVQEQVIVQAPPRVVDSLPPAEEFTEPVYNHFHLQVTRLRILQIFLLCRNRCSFRLFLVSLVHFLLLTSLLPTSRGGHYLSSRCGRLHEHSGTSWRISASSHRWCRSSIFLCRGRWTP